MTVRMQEIARGGLTDTLPSLRQVSAEVAELNALYIQEVSRRALAPAETTNGWRGGTVHVFLRHDKLKVFAVACDNRVGMANYVALELVRYRVDEAGRRQTLEERGPLPNRRTIHAWLTGRLLWAADSGPQPSPELWSPVVYNPVRMQTFRCAATDTECPILTSRFALLTPGTIKVWCDASSVPLASAGSHDRLENAL